MPMKLSLQSCYKVCKAVNKPPFNLQISCINLNTLVYKPPLLFKPRSSFISNLHFSGTTFDFSIPSVETPDDLEKKLTPPQDQECDICTEIVELTRNNIGDEFSNRAMYLLEQAHIIKPKKDMEYPNVTSVCENQDDERAVLRNLILLVSQTENKKLLSKIYIRLMRLYALRGNFVTTQYLFDGMTRDGIEDDNAYPVLMEAYFLGGEFEKTLELFELSKLNSSCLDPRIYATVVRTYMKLNRFKDAVDTVGTMRQKTTPTALVYNSLISACLDVRNADKAWFIYDLMRNNDCKPDSETYSLLIGAIQKKNLNQALKLAEEMFSLKIYPEAKYINSLLAAFPLIQNFYTPSVIMLDSAIGQKFQLEVSTFIAFLRGAQKNKNLIDARRFFVKTLLQKPSPEHLQVAFSAVLSTYAQFCKRESDQHSVNQEISPVVNLDFLDSPAPASFDEAVTEAMKVYAYFERHYQHEMAPSQQDLVKETFLRNFANYNYVNEAMEYFSKHFNEENTTPTGYTSILAMCRRIGSRDLFFKTLNQINLVLAPITPSSNVTSIERTRYKRKMGLDVGPLLKLYQGIIIGLIRFGEFDIALNYFENNCRDADLVTAACDNHYKIFVHVIGRSENPLHKKRLDRLIRTYRPKFLN